MTLFHQPFNNTQEFPQQLTKFSSSRLLKIFIVTEKALILLNSIKLRNENNPEEIQKIFITPDLTPKEQEANKKLIVELRDLNKDGRVYYIKTTKQCRGEFSL